LILSRESLSAIERTSSGQLKWFPCGVPRKTTRKIMVPEAFIPRMESRLNMALLAMQLNRVTLKKLMNGLNYFNHHPVVRAI